MDELIRKINLSKENNLNYDLLSKEWLVTNGLGGYASGTIAGVNTRRYHSFLIAALPAPFGRRVMFNHLSELFKFKDGSSILLGSEEKKKDDLSIGIIDYLKEFRLENGLPVWVYEIDGYLIEKQILLPYMQNTVHINFKLIKGDRPIKIKLKPSIHFRPHEAAVDEIMKGNYYLNVMNNRFEIYENNTAPPLRMFIYGERTAMAIEGGELRNIYYRSEAERGYNSEGQYWSPGYFRAELQRDKDVTLVASTEPWEKILALKPKDAFNAETERRRELIGSVQFNNKNSVAGELVFAADQFIITPVGRAEDAARFEAAGGQLRSIIAGYHWFTDWGRDTMISLEGLTLTTSRHREAYWILRTFAHYVKNGLIPNMFPEGVNQGLYHTADASLWFFHAVDRYISVTNDKHILNYILPALKEIITYHIKGTDFGIGIDKEDCLLKQGAEGYQLTWMDAKVDDWVVTPRRGKAVEINALWYNALCLMEGWLRETDDDTFADELAGYAAKARQSFNKRFWNDKGKYLYDVVDGEYGDDDAFRPNQVFAISLKNPVLNKDKWEPVLSAVKEKLLTPVGLRSLAKGHPDYKEKYFGDLRARDAAYHQGTVWAWLIGPFIDSWLKLYPNKTKEAYGYLSGFTEHLSEACVGQISEVFDAEAPYTPRGCIAQAWSTAEVLRCYKKIEEIVEAAKEVKDYQ